MNAITAGLGTHVIHRIADAGRDPFHNVGRLRRSKTEHIDERIAGVRLVEDDLAADRRNADAVAVARYAGNHTFHDPQHMRPIEGPEP